MAKVINGYTQSMFVKAYFLTSVVALTLLVSCQPPGQNPDGSPDFTPAERTQIYALSPLGEPPKNPSNRYADDPAAAHLGQYLFFDKRLSKNNQISCASCHNPGLGWTDKRATAQGMGTGTRNSPSLWNVAHQRWLFWDGRADSLWSQSLGPLQSSHEMGASATLLQQRFQEHDDLRLGYENIFGPLPQNIQNKKAEQLFMANVGKALEAYERKITSGMSPFDRFTKALRNNESSPEQHLSTEAQKGLRLFVGAGKCILCHQGALLSDGEFHNIGLPALNPTESNPAKTADTGRFAGITKLQTSDFNGQGAFSDAPLEHTWNDKLRYLTTDKRQLGAFRTPSLREVSTTGPYMHDGRFKTLQEVLNFYNAPVGQPEAGEREDTLQPLNMTPEDLLQLEAFLNSLSSGPPNANLITQPKSSVLTTPSDSTASEK